MGMGILLPMFREELTLKATVIALVSAIVFFIVGIILLERGGD